MQYRFGYKIEKEGYEKILNIDASSYPSFATIEDNPDIMAFVLYKLIEEPGITTIYISQEEENISYYSDSVKILYEIANLIDKYRKNIGNFYPLLSQLPQLRQEISNVLEIFDKNIFYDPIAGYVNLKKLLKRFKKISETNDQLYYYLKDLIEFIKSFLNEFSLTNLYLEYKKNVAYYRIGDRSIYKKVIFSDVKPKFVLVKYLSKIDESLNIIEHYNIDKYTEVFILKNREEAFFRYYIYPEENKLFSDELFLLQKAREILIEYQPRREDFLDIERLREVYNKISDNILYSLSNRYKITLDPERYKLIKNILIRYTVGFGILEKISADDKVQDIFVNPPPGIAPITLLHANYELCTTNVILTKREVESWATKLRLISGRPFDEANPILDTELRISDKVLLRVAAVAYPLSPFGTSYIFRRHREKPWTLPLFIYNKMINPLGAALLSFFVSNGRTLLIAGTRGSGKTSLLTALMLEMPRKTRIITIEDTLEIPAEYFRKIGYDIVPLKVRSPFSIQSSEISAENGVRVSLRMGDSALIVGEVRSKEAQTLYEAMRVGALSNAVMGTIHAESPYGVFDRVVNDLGVPRTSFKATDIIVIANPVRDPSSFRRYRRVLRITEVRKHWEEDPIKERGFVDLMVFDVEKDELLPTLNLINGDSDILKSIASRDKFLSKSWERIWTYIEMLAKTKKFLVDFSLEKGRLDLLEADFVVNFNEYIYKLVADSIREYKEINIEYILDELKRWLEMKL